jgi:hypothetical protein
MPAGWVCVWVVGGGGGIGVEYDVRLHFRSELCTIMDLKPDIGRCGSRGVGAGLRPVWAFLGCF